MLISTIALYFYVKNLMRSEVEEELYSTTARVEASLTKNEVMFSLSPLVEVTYANLISPEILKDTIIYDPSQNEMEEFRELSSFKEIKGKIYKITVRNLIVESEDILIAIILSYMTIILLVFVFLLFIKHRYQNFSKCKCIPLPRTSSWDQIYFSFDLIVRILAADRDL